MMIDKLQQLTRGTISLLVVAVLARIFDALGIGVQQRHLLRPEAAT